MTVRAIYENGVFRPTEPVNLPERTQVEFEPNPIAGSDEPEKLTPERSRAVQEIFRIMGERFDIGEHDIAERHNEHQP